MTVLVSDTSVIIDLERGELLESVFQLAVDFAVPDLLFHRELAGPLGDRLLALGLRVEELSPGEVQGATVLRRADATLSLPDTFAFAQVSDSGPKGVDRIMDLTNADTIDLHAIDADATQGGDQAFVQVGAFTHTAGEMVVVYRADIDFTQVRLDVDGDAKADMVIAIRGDHTDFSNFLL